MNEKNIFFQNRRCLKLKCDYFEPKAIRRNMKWFNFYYRMGKWRKVYALMAVLAASMPKFLKRLLTSQLYAITLFTLSFVSPIFGFLLAAAIFSDRSNIVTEWKKVTSFYGEFFREYKSAFVKLYLTCSILLFAGLS